LEREKKDSTGQDRTGKKVTTGKHKHRPAAKPAACAKPLMLSTQEGREVEREEVGKR